MTSGLPARGEKVKVRWPGGPYDFELTFNFAEPCGMYPGWLTLRGRVSSPEGDWYYGVYAHLQDGEWAMLPVGARLAPDGTVVWLVQ